jgi:hypothetical protein
VGIDRWVQPLDHRARVAKRAAFAETRRGVKVAGERLRNALIAASNLTAKQWRRARKVGPYLDHRLHKFHDARKRAATYRAEWTVEREIARLATGSAPLIVGPWLSEVGYEALYWVPFVRWVQATYHIDPDRLIVVTRGGAAAWYRDITVRSVELFDLLTPAAYAERNTQRAAEGGGTLKQWAISPFDEEIASQVRQHTGAAAAELFHPSLMYRLFQQFMLGHRASSFLLRRTRYRRLQVPDVPLPVLPADYVAVKFYTAASLPPTPAITRMLQSMVLALAEQHPVVMLDTGLALDDHDDYTFARAGRIHTVRDELRPQDNLAVQTAIIAKARAFVGTCGSVAWLAPMLGVDTTAVLADARFLHGHLQVARQVFQTLGGGRFSPLDISTFDQLGLTVNAIPAESAGRSPAAQPT